VSLQYLADKGMEYAKRALACDRGGDYENAIKFYKLSIELFTKYLALYPESPLSDFYKELISKYRDRIKVLEDKLENSSKSTESTSTQDSDMPFEVLMPNRRPNKTFSDLVDLDEVKKALKRAVVYSVLNPSLYPLGWPRAILLFGPPGCGKTELALALSNEINATLIHVTPATIMSKWLGDAEKNVKRLFETARKISSSGTPVIIFIDEVDGLFQQYSTEVGGEKRVRNQFLIEMDGLSGKEHSNVHVFIIGATNKPWALDIGFIRRFEKRILVPAPSKDVRKRLFEYYVSKLSKTYNIRDINYDELAEKTEYYSSADIVAIVKEVQADVVEEISERKISPHERPITMSDFLRVIERHRPSIDYSHLEAYREWNKQYGTLE
jgi:SpoVK/Ycf46/Vps4 family AAA+-type ATPase